jgi:uncharacterized damage-inducible protein DinB
MANEVTRITDQLERAFNGPAWHGPAVMESLAGVNAVQAATRPLSGMHTIWEITLHIAAWAGAVTERLKSGKPELPAEGDWPEITDAGEAGWAATLTLLRQRHAELKTALSALTDEQLENRLGASYDAPTASGFTIYETAHGVIQHHLYHAGQITLLVKALS